MITAKSKYRGVSFDVNSSKWVAQIQHNKTKYSIGRFETEEQAFEAYKSKYFDLIGAEYIHAEPKRDGNDLLIPLSQSKSFKGLRYARISLSDESLITPYRWTYRSGYACTVIGRKTVFMHNIIMGVVGIDHINHNGLDNTRGNLRIATQQQQVMNRRKSRNKSSKYKGVCFDNSRKKWMATIGLNYRLKFLGYYDCETSAALAYDKKAKELYGDFAQMNGGVYA